MYKLQDLTLTKLQTVANGVLAFAKYPGWCHEYNFILEPTGKVMGKTSLGLWQELSSESASFIQEKIHRKIFREQ
jgi:hypothetical protein